VVHLRRRPAVDAAAVANGEDPDLVYAEAYANSKVERPGEQP
jgi:hypothetical protein